MFIFNFKIPRNILFKSIIIVFILLSLFILFLVTKKIFTKANSVMTVNDDISRPQIVKITSRELYKCIENSL